MKANNVNIAVLSGDLSSNNTTSFVQDGGITAGILDLTTSGVRSTTGNATGTITSICANGGTTVKCP